MTVKKVTISSTYGLDEGPSGPQSRKVPRKYVFQMLIFLLFWFGAVLFLGKFYRADLEAIGGWFLNHFGTPGLGLGIFLADGLHFPFPPQLLLLTLITSDGPQGFALALICIGSLAGGVVSYWIGREAIRIKAAREWMEGTRARVDEFMRRHGTLAVVVAAIAPIAFSTQCNVIGFYRMPRHLLYLALLLRVPRLVIFYSAIKAGWIASG